MIILNSFLIVRKNSFEQLKNPFINGKSALSYKLEYRGMLKNVEKVKKAPTIL
jgi:hypothetical protein